MKPCSASLPSQPSARQARGKRCRRSRCALTARTRPCSAFEQGLFLGNWQPNQSRTAHLLHFQLLLSTAEVLSRACQQRGERLVRCTTREPQHGERCLGKSPSAGVTPGQPTQSHPEVTENLTSFVKRQLQCF